MMDNGFYFDLFFCGFFIVLIVACLIYFVYLHLKYPKL